MGSIDHLFRFQRLTLRFKITILNYKERKQKIVFIKFAKNHYLKEKFKLKNKIYNKLLAFKLILS